MSNDESTEQGVETSGGAGDQPEAQAGRPARQTRRPRPAPTSGYVPGRRPRKQQPPSMNPYIVPVVALVALLVLLGALLFDHFHGINVAASPTATPTSAPIVPTATPKPTATPIILATPLTTKAGVAAAVDGMPIPMRLYVDESNAAVSQLQVDHQDQT